MFGVCRQSLEWRQVGLISDIPWAVRWIGHVVVSVGAEELGQCHESGGYHLGAAKIEFEVNSRVLEGLLHITDKQFTPAWPPWDAKAFITLFAL